VEAAREAASYALSWQDMERSFHQIRGSERVERDERQGVGVSGPMSQAVVQNFREMAAAATRVSVVTKCRLAIAEADREGEEKRGGRLAGWLGRCRRAEGSLLGRVCGGFEKFDEIGGDDMDIKGVAKALLMGYLEGRMRDGDGDGEGGDGHHRGGKATEGDLLVLLVYLLPEEGVVESLATYFPAFAADLRVWALAPLLDVARVDGDDVPLHAALTAISSGRLDCRRMPVAYLLALLGLDQSALVLSLLYQKWIDPTVVEDVLGCIEILMHEELIIECYVHVKQYLRQLHEMGSYNGIGIGGHAHGGQHAYHAHHTYHNKAKIFWQAMFAAGAERGMLFQLIRLPMTAKDEMHIIEWLRCGDVEKRKALCLYYLLRGRGEEATREVAGLELDNESDWDARLAQLCELANQSTPVIEMDGDTDVAGVGDAGVRMPACMRRNDSREANSPGEASGGGLLFGPPLAHSGPNIDGARSRTNTSMIGVFGAPAVHGVRGRVALSVRGNTKVHKLDRMLEF
jgi:hypothetical protein